MTADQQYRHDAPALYTAAEAAGILRVKTSWLERQAADRKIPFTMLGGSYRFTSAHLQQIVRLHEQTPARQPESQTHRTRRHGRDAPQPADTGQQAPLRPRPRRGPPRAA